MKEKHDFDQTRLADCLPDLSPTVPGHEFVELLWENGRIVMQGKSDRAKKTSFSTAFASPIGKARGEEVRDTVTNPKAIDSVGNGFPANMPSGRAGMHNQEDVVVPSLSRPINDYYLELLSEVSGVDPNSARVPSGRISSYDKAVRDTHNLENGNVSGAPTMCLEPSRIRNSQLFRFQQQGQSRQTLIPTPTELDLTSFAKDKCSIGDVPTKMQHQDLTSCKLMQPTSSVPLMNFPHFSRPLALVESNLHRTDRMSKSRKVFPAASSKIMESTPIHSSNKLKCLPAASSKIMGSQPIHSSNNLKSLRASHGQMTLARPKTNLQLPAHPPQETVSLRCSPAVCQKDAAKRSGNHNEINSTSDLRLSDNMRCHGSGFAAGMIMEKHEIEKAIGKVGGWHDHVSPSMCSTNGSSATSNDVKNMMKRKTIDSEESDYQSEDPEDDSVGAKRPFTGRVMSRKRSRVSDVHNLSERRRRDRINEKMQALQRLIPNCSKVDKASMLDEAIEYLKTLQMQVQIMSLRSGGLSMLPVMPPLEMQHLCASHVGPFAPMGVCMGMGMGMGFGMGMPDMTGSPMMPVPSIQRLQYPCASMPGTAGLHGMHGSTNLQMFRVPAQAWPMSGPHPASTISLMGMPVTGDPRPEVSPMQATDSDPPNSKVQQLQNLEPVGETSANGAQAQMSRYV